MTGSFTGKFIKKEGVLRAANIRDITLYELFGRGLPEGVEVEVYMNVVDPNEKSLSQLAKVHKQIRILAESTGDTFQDMKRSVKEKAGLCIDGTCKSFEGCSSAELSLAIQAATEIGEFVGCYVG